jgi:RimJ/RimL family protein N-acetyltransferase
MDDRDLLALQADALFGSDAGGRIVFEHTPGHRPAPRLYLALGAAGSVLRLRNDVSAAAAKELKRLADAEPPPADGDAHPVHLDHYLRLLADEAPIAQQEPGLTWELPPDTAFHQPATLVRSGTHEGDALIARLLAEGMPPAMVALGFVDTDEFWPPWCVVLDGGEIASIAFAARISDHAADVGLTTVPAFRGRGHGAAATAAWAAHPQLRGRRPFYSTSRTNQSSRRVVERLGLRFIGPTLRIT